MLITYLKMNSLINTYFNYFSFNNSDNDLDYLHNHQRHEEHNISVIEDKSAAVRKKMNDNDDNVDSNQTAWEHVIDNLNTSV